MFLFGSRKKKKQQAEQAEPVRRPAEEPIDREDPVPEELDLDLDLDIESEPEEGEEPEDEEEEEEQDGRSEDEEEEELDESVVLGHIMPHYVLGLIGQSQQGKTTLAAAILQVMACWKGPHGSTSRYDLDSLPEERERGITIAGNIAEAVCDWRHYVLLDCPGDPFYVKNAIAMMPMMDVAVLVVSAREGIMEQTREHVLLARQMGVPYVVGFLNASPDADTEQLKGDVARLLEKNGYEDMPIVVGDCRRAADDPNEYGGPITELVDAIQEYLPDYDRPGDQPFLMGVHQVFRREDVTVVTGCVEQGALRPGSSVELTGLGSTQTCNVQDIQIFHKSADIANVADVIGVALQCPEPDLIRRGQVLAEPGSAACTQTFRARVRLLRAEDGGRRSGISSGYRPIFYFRTAAVEGQIVLDGGAEYLMPGDQCRLTVKLAKPVYLEEEQTFPIRDGERTVGFGQVLEILE